MIGGFFIDRGVGNIQNTGDTQQAAFNLADTNHKGFILIRPTLGQFQEVPVNCFRDIPGNIFPRPPPLIIQGKAQINGFFLNTFHPDHMADGGNSNAFPGILKGVNSGLNLFY